MTDTVHSPCRRLRTRLLPAALLPALLLAGCGERGITAVSPPDGPSLSGAAVQSGSPNLVISQVYGAGGNSGALLTHDYVEIFNRGTTAASLDGLSIQYASATGTGNFGASSTQLTELPNFTLQPGQYYLVQQAGGSVGAPLPPPDHIDPTPIAMAAGAGKVALVTGTTSLGCNGGSTPCTSAQLARILDLVGYGNANFFEGDAAAPTLGAATAAFRLNGGCKDTDQNGADFAAQTPAPRNSSSALNVCPVGPTVTATSPASGATDVALDANIQVTFSKPVQVSGEWFSIVCTTSGARTATVGGGPTTFTLEVEGSFAGSESCTVTILASGVTDQGTPPVGMTADHSWSFATVDVSVCELPFTPIYEIQGSGATTPFAGQMVTAQGVVIGAYEYPGSGTPGEHLRGFYLQDPDGDGDPQTSDGIFVFSSTTSRNVAVGDLVRVRGQAAEFQDQTQISLAVAGSSAVVCGSGHTIEPTDVTLPWISTAFPERYEGMLVRLPQTLTVTEHYHLGRFGAVVMTSGNRLYQPTQVAAPGAAAAAVQADNDRDRIVIDDDLNNQNPDPILFGRGGNPLTASNTLRAGDRATGIVGVMTYTWAGAAASGNAWRVRPVGAMGGGVPNFVATNARPAAPSVGGSLRVVAFNVYNYFNSFSGCTGGVGGASMDCRGARNAAEFQRQWQKTVAAIVTMNADVLGLMEMENDGYGPQSAIVDLVERLNAATAPGTYAFIDADAATGQLNALGTDAIKNALIYKPAKVTPVGTTAALNSTAFQNGGDPAPRNRPSLVQAFQQNANGARFIASVNHLKSKGSACSVPDAGDGQGNCSVVRTNAANLLREWLATDPTGTGDPDILILGDLNSYAMEDPIRAFVTNGYVDLAAAHLGPQSYSYAFDGQWGTLDYALASPSLSSQVAGVVEWHVNSDEPIVLDYSMAFKSAGQIASLYSPDPFRNSDHDPIVVGLNLAPPLPFGGFLSPIANLPATNVVNAGRTVPIKFSLGGNRGMNIFANGYPASRVVSCSTWAPTGNLARIESPGGSGLSYDASTGIYEIGWNTEKSWEGSCRELVVRFTDGSTHSARFDFR